MNKLKKIIRVLRKKTVKPFKPLYVKFFIFRNKEKRIKEISDFHSNDRNEIFNFISNKYFGLFGAMQIKSEFMELLRIVESKRPKYVLEVGTAAGGALFCFSKLSSEDAVLVSVDLPEGKFGGGYKKWKVPFFEAFKKGNQKMFLLREDSHKNSTLNSVKGILSDQKLDFLFIDGDHTYEGVKNDFEMYSPLVKKGGVVAFHDITNGSEEYVGGVPRFWKEVKFGREYKEFIEDLNQGKCGIGVLFV
jgi:predicted O-methyltransferase YrrM